MTITRADGTPLTVSVEAARKHALKSINRERRSTGRSPLRMDPVLNKIAQRRSVDMTRRNYFSHNDPANPKRVPYVSK